MSVFRHGLKFFLFALLILAGAACGSSNGSESTAQVRFIQASPDALAGLTLTWHGNWLLTDLSYAEDSGYFQAMNPGMDITVIDGVTGEKLFNFDASFADDVDYTIVFANPRNEMEALILVDDLRPAPAGQFKLRLLHMAPSVGDVDIYIIPPGFTLEDTIALAADVQYKGGTPYFTPDAGSYQLVVTESGTTNVIKQLNLLAFEAGQIRSAVLLESPGGGAPYSLKIMTDGN